MILQHDPLATFENKGGVCPIQTAVFNGVLVAANNLLVAAVANQRIKVVGGNVYSNGLATALVFISASGGTALRAVYVPANTAAPPNVPLVATRHDTFETLTGQGLYVTNTTVVAILSLNYIIYTP